MLITIEEKPRRNRGLCLQSEISADAEIFLLLLNIIHLIRHSYIETSAADELS